MSLSSSAQTDFFSSSFPVLHNLLLDFLSDPDSPHPVLPFLQVSRYWRSFARAYLLKPFEKTKEAVEGKSASAAKSAIQKGAYVKVSIVSKAYKSIDKEEEEEEQQTKRERGKEVE